MWQFGITNLIAKVAQIFADFWTSLKRTTFSVKTAFVAFWTTFDAFYSILLELNANHCQIINALSCSFNQVVAL